VRTKGRLVEGPGLAAGLAADKLLPAHNNSIGTHLTWILPEGVYILYYGSPVWLTPATGAAVLADVEKLHFKALRIVTRDYRQRTSREVITKKTQRLPPNFG